jgi:hypothetical protein
MRKLSIITWLSAALLTACGGANTLTGSTSTSTGGTGGGTNGPAVAAITAISSVPSILSDGSSTATITALVKDSNNNLIAGVPVKFTPTSGAIAVTQGTTDTAGAAIATLSTPGDASLRTITVTATASGKTATVNVQVVAGSTPTTVQMGNPAGANFKPAVIGISSASLSAGGSTSLTVALQQSDGTLYAQSVSVSFNSSCVAQGLASITSPVTTSTGIATATYSAKGCNGTDAITATATVGSNSLSASGSVTVAPASIGSIIYKSATPTLIALKGSGSTTRPESSTVVFQVLDSSGGPVVGANVTFALNTSVGGVSVNVGPVKSDASGNVQTTVQAGTVATPVRVTATVQNTTPAIATQSNQLTVSTGIPTQNAFSIAVTSHNVEGFNLDGIQVTVTARLADRFNNPVADGTAVSFRAEGGHILPQCTTTTTATESGVCGVTWTSANPRPTVGKGGRAGRVRVFATAIGEEAFTDLNGNGAFDPGEPFTDLAERFEDDNQDGVYQSTEPFYDFNNNGVRDPADGIFNGVLCNDPARCDGTKASTGIDAQNEIIMSGSTPDNLNPKSGTTLAGPSQAAGAGIYTFYVADINNNPMPAGTTVGLSVTGTGLSVGAPSSFTYPSTEEPLNYAFTVLVGSGAIAGSTVGQLTLDIKTPSGVESIATYSFTVAP